MTPESASVNAIPEPAPASAPGERSVLGLAGRAGRVQSRYPAVQVLALIVIFVWGSTTIDGFDSSPSIKSMLVLAALLGLSAVGQTLVVLIGGLDLAVPGFIAVGAVMTAQLGGLDHWSVGEIIPVIAVICAICGSVNGWICHRFRVNPLIVTLGMYSMLQGGVLVWTGGHITGVPPASLSNWTSAIGTTFGMGVPPVVVVWGVVAVILGIALSVTPTGRSLYATGINLRAARIALVHTERIWTAVFGLCGALSGLAGVLIAGYSSGASLGIGDPYLFQGLAAVIVGGTALGSARGDYWRTVLGALMLTALTTILVGKGFDDADTQMLYGFLILLVVAGYGRNRQLKDRI